MKAPSTMGEEMKVSMSGIICDDMSTEEIIEAERLSTRCDPKKETRAKHSKKCLLKDQGGMLTNDDTGFSDTAMSR